MSERGWRNISLTLNRAKFSTRGTRFKVHQSLCQALFSYYYYFFFAYRLTNKTGKHLSSLPSLNQPDSFAKALPRRRSKLKVAQLWQKKKVKKIHRNNNKMHCANANDIKMKSLPSNKLIKRRRLRPTSTYRKKVTY